MTAPTIASNQLFREQHFTPVSNSTSSTFIRSYNVLALDIDGSNKIAELVVALFAIVDAFWKTTPQSLKLTFQVFQDHIDVTIFICLFKRIRDWSRPDEKGKMVWEYHWQYIASMVCFTASQIFTTLSYLHYLAVIGLGNALNAVNNLSSLFMMFSCALDIWSDALTLQNVTIKQAKSDVLRIKWTDWKTKFGSALTLQSKKHDVEHHLEPVEKAWKTHCYEKIQKWDQRIQKLKPDTDADALERAQKKKHDWTQLSGCKNLQGIAKYCGWKAEKWEATSHNETIERKKLWVNMAINALCVSLFVLGFIFTGPTLFAIELSILVLTVITDAVDLVGYVMDELFPAKEIPVFSLPKC